MRSDFLARLATRVLVCDGAMGTMLHASGVPLDRSLPELNLSNPALVRAIHRAYIQAGADIIQTNTFGASRQRLARHGFEDRVAEINRAGVRVAQEARESAEAAVLVAGSVGPVAPPGFRGQLSLEELRSALREQIEALVAGGVDLLLFETFGDLREMVEAVEIAKTLTALPLVAQMTFVDDGRTIAGDSPEEVAATLEQLGVAVVGANCTLGPQGLLEVLRQLSRHTSLPLAAQPNAGRPTLLDGRFVYAADGEYFARYARRFVELGAALVGGCCGTTPHHIEAVARAVAGLRPAGRRRAPVVSRLPAAPHVEAVEPAGSRLAEKLAAGRFVIACELPPPLGGDAERALRDAALLKEAGADAIVIAPASSARAQMSPVTLALLLQQRLQIETILSATTWDKGILTLQADLLGAHALGIRNVLCLTGTPPLQGDYPHVAGIWDVDSIGLIQVLRSLNEGRDRNGIPIGKPTAFFIGTRVNPTAEDRERELTRVRRKLAAGAQFLVTRPVYDLGALQALLDALGAQRPPLLLGVMPLQDFKHAEYLQHEVPGMALPEAVLERMWAAGDRGPEVGIEIATELILAARDRVNGILVKSASGSAVEIVQLLRAIPG
ncbi:MAG TPA: bifunctional homocysteine S-methyltransferase/methylenetetrahydrofolate reductase [Chloroflexota bacterium]|nr:bifunctional homocysteine S-methyltransferase/methylenetetrahydrofolate reductase [Chloroflexota bacterium]